MKKTILQKKHHILGARMGEFGGWDMPIQYEGILAEHQQTRTAASLFDICHMGEFEISGSTAEADLERLLTCSISSLNVGQVRYGYLLNEMGGVLDDLTVYRLANDRFWLVVNAGTAATDAAWISKHLQQTTLFKDISDQIAKLDLQGPAARIVLEEVYGCSFADLRYFCFQSLKDGWVSRTGYTGELGYELYLPVDAAAATWDAVLAHSKCAPAGLGARDTLRLEMGYPLYGHELDAMHSPVETGNGMFMNWNKAFMGKARCESDQAEGTQRVVGLQLSSKRAAREQDRVFYKNQPVGYITSGSLAPSLNVAVAMARIEASCCEVGQQVEVEIRGRFQEAIVVSLPFYKSGSARV
ncbi:MAG TPA: glycine cleavage system aminomethyltransferase GcvT [Verrucomicrobia bacterium]|nr:glycine cleavage system aminomethyltransferase GcvT [Verrucomicrobiota bacterium]